MKIIMELGALLFSSLVILPSTKIQGRFNIIKRNPIKIVLVRLKIRRFYEFDKPFFILKFYRYSYIYRIDKK